MGEYEEALGSQVVNDAISFSQNMMEIMSSNKLTEAEFEKLKAFIPVGKDLVLSDLSHDIDRELFIKESQLLSILMEEQEKNFIRGEVMDKGLISSIKLYFQRFIYFVISTRATGPDRERMVQANPQHQMNKILAGQNRPSAADRVFGSKQGG